VGQLLVHDRLLGGVITSTGSQNLLYILSNVGQLDEERHVGRVRGEVEMRAVKLNGRIQQKRTSAASRRVVSFARVWGIFPAVIWEESSIHSPYLIQ